MSTRFGAVSPAQARKVWQQWVMIGAVILALVFFASIAFVSRSQTQPDQPVATNTAAPQQAAPAAAANGMKRVLYTTQRIESNSELQETMFVARELDANEVPEQAILESELPTLRGKYASAMINAHLPVLRSQVTDKATPTIVEIPNGYRGVTILVDKRSGIEGLALPGSRVDVVWAYLEPNGQRRVATIVKFAKVLSVGGVTNKPESGPVALADKAKTPVTLLVTESDGLKIEYARTTGELSLNLVGATSVPESNSQGAKPIGQAEVIGAPEEAREQQCDGTMETVDQATGRPVMMCLQGRKWVRKDNK